MIKASIMETEIIQALSMEEEDSIRDVGTIHTLIQPGTMTREDGMTRASTAEITQGSDPAADPAAAKGGSSPGDGIIRDSTRVGETIKALTKVEEINSLIRSFSGGRKIESFKQLITELIYIVSLGTYLQYFDFEYTPIC